MASTLDRDSAPGVNGRVEPNAELLASVAAPRAAKALPTGALAVVLVLALSLLLLLYVGFGEARRTYPALETSKLAAEGEQVQTSIMTFLLAGLPVEQFPGFTTLTQPVLEADPSISAISVTDPAGKIVFSNSLADSKGAPPDGAGFHQSGLDDETAPYRVTESAAYYRVTFPLSGKLGPAGSLHLTIAREQVTRRITASFAPSLAVGVMLVLGFLGLILPLAGRARGAESRVLGIGYGVSFFLMAVMVIVTLVNLYAYGIEARTRALAQSLGQRLSAPLELGIGLDSLDQLDQALKGYQKLNPDLSVVALTDNGIVLIDTSAARVGKAWASSAGQFEYDVALAGSPQGSAYAVHVGIPKSAVYGKLWRAAKDFIALFVASVLLSTLFFNLISAYRQLGSAAVGQEKIREYQLRLLEPLYFMAVFADGLTKSFLPQHFRDVASGSHANLSLASALFTVYFLGYALAIFPAGRYAERGDVKVLLVAGMAMEAASLTSLAFVHTFYLLFLTQLVSGLGQGILFSGVQAAILHLSARHSRVRSQAIVAYGFNGGILSGAAIGALLVADPALGQTGTFLVAGGVGLLVVVYTLALVRSMRASDSQAEGQERATPHRGLLHDLMIGLRDAKFLRASLLIGVPTKVVMAGLISASLPLLLTQASYRTEDIGQILMLYSAGVLVSTRALAHLANRLSETAAILVLGSLGSGVGLALIGFMGVGQTLQLGPLHLATLALIAGLSLLGVMHGLVQTPVVAFLAGTPVAGSVGVKSAISVYRLFERIGNVGGPIVLSQLLLASHGSAVAIAWLGAAVALFGLLFAIGTGGHGAAQSARMDVPIISHTE